MALTGKKSYHLAFAILGFTGAAVGAYVVVMSVITLSTLLSIPDFLVSFFVVGVGTSLPELVIDLWAVKRKYYDLVIGDIIGSCIVDATLSVGIGPVFSSTRYGEVPPRRPDCTPSLLP